MIYAAGPRGLQDSGFEAESFEALADLAIANIGDARNLGVVCGPISTGGTENQVYNFQIFNACIKGLSRQGEQLFDQTPYEFGLRRLAMEWEAAGNQGYCFPILSVFYARVFESGAITKGWFIPGWRSSTGARWEREKLERAQNTTVYDLTKDEVSAFFGQQYCPSHMRHVIGLLAK